MKIGFRFMRYLARIFRAIFGIGVTEYRPLLRVKGTGIVTGLAGKTKQKACRAIVVDEESGDGLAGLEVSFRVIDGPFKLGGGAQEITLHSDRNGLVEADVLFETKGTGLVTAELAQDEYQNVGYDLRTEGVTHEISVHVEPCHSVNPGEIPVRVFAIDHLERPVTGAELVLEGTRGIDLWVEADLREIGAGLYEGTLKTQVAGKWTVTAEDPQTKVVGRECVHLIPGPAESIVLSREIDPRAAAPRDRLPLHVALLDHHGNALDPLLLSALSNAKQLAYTVVGDEAVFDVTRIGPGPVTVEISAEGSAVALKETIQFAAASLSLPDVIKVGSRFTTDVFLYPPADRSVSKATVRCKFDAELSSYVGFEPAPDSTVEVTASTTENNRIEFAVVDQDGLEAAEFPEGVFLGTCTWECLDKGETCFEVSAVMSPESPAWERCTPQKVFFDDDIQVCVNIIFRAQNTKARDAGVDAGETAGSLFDAIDNLSECCPPVNFNVHPCGVQTAEWNQIRRIVGGNDTAQSSGQVSRVLRHLANTPRFNCRRPHCINILMLDIDVPDYGGAANHGVAVVDPDVARRAPFVLAHEIGHILGLPDRYTRDARRRITDRGDKKDLMSGWTTGYKMTEEDCRKIHENIGSVTGR